MKIIQGPFDAKHIEIEVERFRGREDDKHCLHPRWSFDKSNHLLRCGVCDVQLDPLNRLMDYHDRMKCWHQRLEADAAELAALEVKKGWIRVLKRLAGHWYGKHKQAVCCPHCNGGILPTDEFGYSSRSEKAEMARRGRINPAPNK